MTGVIFIYSPVYCRIIDVVIENPLLIHPVRNPNPAIAGLETERGIISNGVRGPEECSMQGLETKTFHGGVT